MEFENEPEGWDDHIIQHPPHEDKTLDPAIRGIAIGCLVGLVVWGIFCAIFYWATR